MDADNPDVHIVDRGKAKRLSEQDRNQFRRRQAMEPIIGHLKADHRMGRCYIKGSRGDSLHNMQAVARHFGVHYPTVSCLVRANEDAPPSSTI